MFAGHRQTGDCAAREKAAASIDFERFAASLKVAWSEGERRPTHRRRYVRTKLVLRTKMLDAVRDQLLAWLEARPAISAVEALERLRGLYPDRFGADQLRTVQRFMKLRRAAMAREVLLGPMPCPEALGMMAAVVPRSVV